MDKFTFILAEQHRETKDDKMVYTAEKMKLDYKITWERDGKELETRYLIRHVEEFLENKDWLVQ